MANNSTEDKRVIHQKITEFQREQKNKLIQKQNVELKRLLKQLAFQIFILIADADQNIDSKEIAEFRKFLGEREKHCSNPYSRRIFHSTVVNYGALLDAYNKKKIRKDIRYVEKTMAYVSRCISRPKMEKFCLDLKELALAIAEASGGFMGMGSHICDEEQKVLKQLDQIFAESIENACGPVPTEVSFFKD